jgi:hypothetical protein
MADIVVLTEYAPEITMGEENSSGSMLADKGGFFTKVREGAREHQVGSGLTVTQLSLQPVGTTLPGTEPALPQDLIQKLNPSGQLPCAEKLDIRGDKSHFENTST